MCGSIHISHCTILKAQVEISILPIESAIIVSMTMHSQYGRHCLM